jgi:geranylgeranyl pyrophosphate synthase
VNESDVLGLQKSLSVAAEWVRSAFPSTSLLKGRTSRLPVLAAYSIDGGGKRIRPFLVRAACAAGGGDPSRCIHAAVAVEMIHTYSLIHDDLPSMDDDDLRRGRPTLHRVEGAGVAQAVLAGDRLLVEAFAELLLSPLPPASVSSLVHRLATAAGAGFLAGGQFMDIHPPAEPTRAWAERMIEGKTSAMIRVSLELGALSGGFDRDMMSAVSCAGDRLGLLFQITDDILDVCGTSEELGKSVAKDSALGKANFVTIMGLEAAKAEAAVLSSRLADEFASLPGNWEDAGLLARYLPVRRS